MAEIFASKTAEIEEREVINAQISRKLAGECMVLLENDGALPIHTKKVALFGNGARATIKGGTGSGDVNTRNNVNIEQGFQNAGIEVTTTAWLDRQEQNTSAAKAAYVQWMKEEAARKQTSELAVMFDHPYKEPDCEIITINDIDVSETDTAVYVIARNSGEGADRFDEEGDYRLYPHERGNIHLLAEVYDKLIVVLNIGGVMDLSEMRSIAGVNAILLMTQLGNLGGDALLDVLTGKVNPSGKTTDTWAENYMDYPSSAKFSHNESVHDEMYEDGIYVGYRYFDSFGVKPLYCFGYGKSYTDFEIKAGKISVEGNEIQIPVTVKNTGKIYAGKEVVQVYYSAAGGVMEKPYQELAVYQKTKLLAPGETEEIVLKYQAEQMASYSEKEAAWIRSKQHLPYKFTALSKPKTFLKLLIFAQCQNGYIICQHGFRLDRHIGFPSPLNSKNVDSESPADVQLPDVFTSPRLRHFHFKNCVLVVDFYVVKDMIGAVSNRSPLCHLLFRVDHMIGSIAK